MPKFLFKTTLSQQGMQGTIKEGATGRRAQIEELTKGLGGSLEAFYYAFGETDAYVIADVPNNETAAAVAMAVSASGAATIETVVLLTPEEVEEASAKTVDYRPPGA